MSIRWCGSAELTVLFRFDFGGCAEPLVGLACSLYGALEQQASFETEVKGARLQFLFLKVFCFCSGRDAIDELYDGVVVSRVRNAYP